MTSIFEKGRTDGYQWTVNSYFYAVDSDYARGVAEGKALRRLIHAPPGSTQEAFCKLGDALRAFGHVWLKEMGLR